MNTIHRTPWRNLRVRLPGLIAAACLVVTCMQLAGCAYTETMRQRTSEGEQLRSELDYEQGRAEGLAR
jgi:hypothetical protein